MRTRYRVAYETFDRTRRIDMTQGGYLYADHTFFDAVWAVKFGDVSGRMGSYVSERYLEPFEHRVLLQTHSRDRSEFNRIKGELLECCAYDMVRGELGRLIVNGWSLDCNVTEIRQGKETLVDVTKYTLTIVAPRPVWYRETVIEWPTYEYAAQGKRYPRQYASRYGSNNVFEVSIDSIWPLAFAVRFFGPCVDPSITINGHLYAVMGACDEGESLAIDTRNRKVYKVITTGEIVNAFDRRGKSSNPFELVAPGILGLTRAGEYPIELTLCQMRPYPEMEVK